MLRISIREETDSRAFYYLYYDYFYYYLNQFTFPSCPIFKLIVFFWNWEWIVQGSTVWRTAACCLWLFCFTLNLVQSCDVWIYIYTYMCVCVCACEWVRKRWYALAWTHVWFVLVEVLKRIQACKLQYFSATSCVLDYVDKKGGTLNYYSFGKCLCSVLFLVILDEDVTFWAVVLVVLFVCLFLLYWGTSSPSMATEESNR